jgi:hypothetical protein
MLQIKEASKYHIVFPYRLFPVSWYPLIKLISPKVMTTPVREPFPNQD